MPTSQTNLLNEVCEIYRVMNPKSALDIGVGWGHYGVLFRMISDVRFGRISPEQWIVTIDGVEIFKPYWNDIYKVYNWVHNCNIQDFKFKAKYDLIYCGDVIEHFVKADAFLLIEKLKANCKNMIIALPLGNSPQGETFGNVHEKHLSTWYESDFVSLGFKTNIIKGNKGLFYL